MIDDDALIGNTFESPLPPAILRGLADRSYDKRRKAAAEVTHLVKGLVEENDKDTIASVLLLLVQEFCTARNPNHRKGGLIGLSAVCVSFSANTLSHRHNRNNMSGRGIRVGTRTPSPPLLLELYLHLLVPPIIQSFYDQDSRVVYYACEAMYNVVKLGRASVLVYFNDIFDGLCSLFAHVDVDVKSGATVLDRMVKDVVCETDSFGVEIFIPLVVKHIKKTKPYIRQLLVGWVSVLNNVPDMGMLDYLPEFLEGLFNMLSDGNRSIRQSADEVLSALLSEIELAELADFGSITEILIKQCVVREKLCRLRALQWLHSFIHLGGSRLRMYYCAMLGSIIHCISDVDNAEIARTASIANSDLMELVRSTQEEFELQPILYKLTVEVLSDHIITRASVLLWIEMFYKKNAANMNKHILVLLPVLLNKLSDDSDKVLIINVRVIARICLDPIQFNRVFQALNMLFLEDRHLLETRGVFIIRNLCGLLDCKKIFLAISNILTDKLDIEYISLMVQTLNVVLVTSPELSSFRNLLSDSLIGDDGSSGSMTDEGKENKQVFVTLYKCWCHNPAAIFSLCLLSQAYEISAELVHRMTKHDVSVGFLIQIDNLIHLIESPSFIHLRLQLIELDRGSPKHSHLIQSLHGLLSLLPQSTPYGTLSRRLASVGALQMSLNYCEKYGTYDPTGSSNVAQKKSKSAKFGFFGGHNKKKNSVNQVGLDIQELKDRFVFVQDMHYKHRSNMLDRYTLPGSPEEAVQSVFEDSIASGSRDVISVQTVPLGTLIP